MADTPTRVTTPSRPASDSPYVEFTPPEPPVTTDIPLTPADVTGGLFVAGGGGRPGTTPLAASSAPVDPGMIPEDIGAMRETDSAFIVEFTNPGESMDFEFSAWGGRDAARTAARDYQEQRAKDKAEGFVTPTPLPPAQGHPFNAKVNDAIRLMRKPIDYVVSRLPISQESVDKAKERVEKARESVQAVLEANTTLLDPIEPSIAPPPTPPHYRPTDRNSYSTGEVFNWKFGHYHQKVVPGFPSSIRSLCYDEWHILLGTWDGTVYIVPWHPPDDGVLESDHTLADFAIPLHGHGGSVVAVALSLKYICTGSVDSTVRVLDRNTLHTIHALSGHNGAVTGLYLSSSGKYLFSSGIDGVVCSWNLETGMPERSMTFFQGEAITCMSGVDDRIAIGYASGQLALAVRSPGEHATEADLEITSRVEGHSDAITAIAIHGNRICTGARDRLRVWQMVDARIAPEAPEALRLVRAGTFPCGTTGESVAAIHFDDATLVCSYSRSVQVWDVTTGSMLYSRPSPAGAVLALQFDGQQLVMGGYPHTLVVWDFSAGYIPPSDDASRTRHVSLPEPGTQTTSPTRQLQYGDHSGTPERARAASHPVEAVALTMQQAAAAAAHATPSPPKKSTRSPGHPPLAPVEQPARSDSSSPPPMI